MESESKRKRREATECQICGDRAIYCFFGSIVCQPCKMFFKRNAPKGQEQFQCHFDGDCQVNINNRHVCAACRLKKCFRSGMRVEALRNGQSQPRKTTTELRPVQLLQQDRSSLTSAQWTHLSNIIHCYDEYSHFTAAERYIVEQNRLPMKFRFKANSILEAMARLATGGQLLYEKNVDFLALPASDRAALFRKTVRHVVGLNSCFIGYAAKFLDTEPCYENMKAIYGTEILQYGYLSGRRFDRDLTFFKLILPMLIFSTFYCTDYTLDSSIESFNIKTVLHIQDQYIELAWKYMVYKYDHQRAVQAFSSAILSLLALHRSVTRSIEIEQYKTMIDTIVEETGQVVLHE